MIKLRKLIPAVSTLGIIPVAMVSCAKYDYVTWTKGQEFKPSIKKYEPKADSIHTFEEAAYTFRDLTKKNHKIVSETIVSQIYEDETSGVYQDERTIDKVSFAVTDIGFSEPEDESMSGAINCKVELSGEFKVNILGVDQVIKLKNSQFIFGDLTFIFAYDNAGEHHFSLRKPNWTGSPERVNMPYFYWEEGKIKMGKNKDLSYHERISDKVMSPILNAIFPIFINGQCWFFDNVEWGE